MANPDSEPTPAGGLAPGPRSPRRKPRPPAPDADFWAVFESAPDAYLLLAPDPPRFTMVAANEARLRATLTRREDVVGRALFEVFPDNPDDPGATGVRNLQASLAEVMRTGKPHRMALQKYDIRSADGQFEERWWEPLNAPVFDARGRLIYLIHRVEDVTERVRADTRLREESAARREVEAILAKLRESEARYRLLADMIPQNIWTADAAGRHTWFSRRWYEYTGATPEASHGEGWAEFIHPDDRERMDARWRRSLDTGEPYEIEYRFRGAGGEYRWFLGKAMPLRNDAGEIVEWFGTSTDISERKRHDEERERLLAREREARGQVTTILESVTDAFYAFDREWRFTYVNREAERLLKRPREELIGRSLWDEFAASVGSELEREYRRAMAEQITVTFETFAPTIGIWVDVRAYPSAGGLSVFFRDVTARRQAEERLRESEERYRLLADMIPQHIWITDANGYHNYFSRRWYEFTGTTPGETRGDGWLAYIHPDDRERTLARWEHSLRTGERYSIEYRFRDTAGDYCWFWGQAVPQRNEAGEIVQWFGTLTDISDRKRLDEERDRLLAREREAADQVSTILESITDAFFAVDRGWRFSYVNHEAEALLDRPREQLLGRSLWEEFPQAAGATFEREYRRAMEEQATVQFEDFYPPLDAWFDVRAYPTADGLSVYFRNITARKRAEQALRESEERFRALGNSIPQLAWMADPQGSIFWYNERWHEYTGTTLEEMQGWGWTKVHHPAHMERVVARIRHSFETGEPWEDTFPIRGRTGEYRWFLSRALPIRDEQGKVVRWFGTNTDVTAEMEAAAERERLLEREREARAEAERRREELERVTESRTRLMRGFSHDVKNPLGAADGYAQLLEDGILGELSPKQVESVGRMRRSIQTSLHLINDLLELARAEAGQIELEPVPTDVAELAREAAEDFRAQAAAAELALEVRAAGAVITRTDPARVRQILSNLLSNAVKYTPGGGITVDACFVAAGRGARGADCIAIRVADTGPGIPEDKQERIFQEFTRLDPEAEHGAGVGLAISRRIARLLGGDITVASAEGGGSTFTLWLPPDASR